MTEDIQKEYLSFNPDAGYPAGGDLYYECGICCDVLPSIPTDNILCKCRNIVIDVDAGRISIKDHSKVKMVRITREI